MTILLHLYALGFCFVIAFTLVAVVNVQERGESEQINWIKGNRVRALIVLFGMAALWPVTAVQFVKFYSAMKRGKR